MKNLQLYIFLLFVYFKEKHALSDAEMREKFTKDVMICSKDYPVDMTDLLSLQQLQTPTKRQVKCLLACAYKRIGTMDKEGRYNLENSYKLAELAKDGDEKRLENGKKLADICSKVNDEKVSDSEGCDRAALMFKCAVDHAPKLGFQIQ